MTRELAAAESSLSTLAERRRAGRSEGASTGLIPLLRGSALLVEGKNDPDLLRFGTDQSAPARGILNGILLSAIVWAGLVMLVRAVM